MTDHETPREDTPTAAGETRRLDRAGFSRLALERAARAAHDAGDHRDGLARQVTEAKGARKAAKQGRKDARARLELADRDVSVAKEALASLRAQLAVADEHATKAGKDAEKVEREHNEVLKRGRKQAQKDAARAEAAARKDAEAGKGAGKDAAKDAPEHERGTSSTRRAVADAAEKVTDRVAEVAMDLEEKADDAAAKAGVEGSSGSGSDSGSGTAPRTRRPRTASTSASGTPRRTTRSRAEAGTADRSEGDTTVTSPNAPAATTEPSGADAEQRQGANA